MVWGMTTPENITHTGRGRIPNLDTFGARLALIRQEQGWNIARAARECGLDGESWRLWEQGREPARRIDIARAIAARTGIDYLWLVHGPIVGLIPTGSDGGTQPTLTQAREVVHSGGYAQPDHRALAGVNLPIPRQRTHDRSPPGRHLKTYPTGR